MSLHRVGRTGRFGSLGVSVSYVTSEELEELRGYLKEAQAGGRGGAWPQQEWGPDG